MTLTINGDPLIQERPRKGRGGHFYDPTAAKKKGLGLAMMAERIMQKKAITVLPITVQMGFYCKGKRGDLDNMIKALLDAGNGVLWKDDRQVVGINARVFRDCGTPRTELSINEITGGHGELHTQN